MFFCFYFCNTRLTICHLPFAICRYFCYSLCYVVNLSTKKEKKSQNHRVFKKKQDFGRPEGFGEKEG